MFMFTSRRIVFTLLILMLTQGCSVNKRYHNTGLNIQWNWHLKSNTSSPKIGLGNKKPSEQTKPIYKTVIPLKESDRSFVAIVPAVSAPLKTDIKNLQTKPQNNSLFQSNQLFSETTIKVSKITRDPSPNDKILPIKTTIHNPQPILSSQFFLLFLREKVSKKPTFYLTNSS